MMKKQLYYLSLLILLLLCGCEVALHENYVGIDPLQPNIPIEINLDAEQNANGELLLTGSSSVKFQIDTPKTKFLLATFYIGNMSIHETHYPQGKFDINSRSLTENNQLRCVIISKGGNVCEQVYGGRTYINERCWSIHVIPQN
ncbi:hypothetical protein [Bacteroides sp. UBA939]|uniref:hypothetical protein n=1 Tax=Bacteroides sp. UBA939 TaxID=1946092 RepID=UPI0025B9D57B|nr:hypothetical protein [Bacteroides sp. UBA939]